MIELESKACAFAKVDKNIYIGTMDQSIQAFNLKVILIFPHKLKI